jgi:uncharacterized membrane protein YjgN (DUF898 family)
MSYQATLSTWSGANKADAAEKLAVVFRLDNEKAISIVDHLCQGLPWRFDRRIPDHQADTASTYLRSLGFVVDFQPVEGEVEPLPEPVVTEEASKKEKVTAPEENYGLRFQGNGRTLLTISFVNLLKTVFTFGVYRFWAKTNIRKYIWAQTLFSGDRFSYHGTGKELFNAMFQFGGVIVLLGLINIYIFFNVGPQEGELFSDLLFLVFVFMIPVLLVGAWKYRLSRSAWRNIRFSFRGKRMNAFVLYFIGCVYTVLTLGIYWPFFKMKSENFWRENSWFGDVQFRFSGTGKDFFMKYVLAILLTPLTLGFYLFWFTADLKRYLWSHTHLGGATFHFPIKGKDYMRLKVTNFFIILFTLGVCFPWVVVRNQKFVTNNLVLAGNIELNCIIQKMKISGTFGDKAMDVMDIPIEIG